MANKKPTEAQIKRAAEELMDMCAEAGVAMQASLTRRKPEIMPIYYTAGEAALLIALTACQHANIMDSYRKSQEKK